MTEMLVDCAGVIVNHFSRSVGTPSTRADGHTHVARIKFGQLLRVCSNRFSEAPHDFDAIIRCHVPPGRERGMSARDCLINIVRCC